MNNNPIVYKDPTGHTITQGDGGCTSKADCAVVSQAVIRDLINQGQIDEAIKLTVIYYRIDTHGASISYDKNNDEGLEPVCKIGKEKDGSQSNHGREISSPFFIASSNPSKLF